MAEIRGKQSADLKEQSKKQTNSSGGVERPLINMLETQFLQIAGDPTKIPKKELLQEQGINGSGSYWVVDPYFNYKGKSYSEWISDWFNWFISADADKRTLGPVVFLRSRGLPSKSTGANIPDVPGQLVGAEARGDALTSDAAYPGTYVNDLNVKVGGDRIQIFANQAVLVPIIIAYELVPPSRDWGTLHEFTGLTIDYGDNPPSKHQLTVNNKDIELPSKREMEDFRITTPIFTAVVPDIEYGRSIKDFLETPVAPGNYPAIVDGYFVMLRFTKGHYWVHSWASGPRETVGPYFSELLYQIEVIEPKAPIPVRTAYRPSRNERLLDLILQQKHKMGELYDDELGRLKKYKEQGVFKTD
jgi:hypothetical protein